MLEVAELTEDGQERGVSYLNATADAAGRQPKLSLAFAVRVCFSAIKV